MGKPVQLCECGNQKSGKGEGCERCKLLSRRFYMPKERGPVKHVDNGPTSLHMADVGYPVSPSNPYGLRYIGTLRDPDHVGRSIANLIDAMEDMDTSDG